MNCKFYIRTIEGGTHKRFGFYNPKMGIADQINAARKEISKIYNIDIEDVIFEDFTYSGEGQWIKI